MISPLHSADPGDPYFAVQELHKRRRIDEDKSGILALVSILTTLTDSWVSSAATWLPYNTSLQVLQRQTGFSIVMCALPLCPRRSHDSIIASNEHFRSLPTIRQSITYRSLPPNVETLNRGMIPYTTVFVFLHLRIARESSQN